MTSFQVQWYSKKKLEIFKKENRIVVQTTLVASEIKPEQNIVNIKVKLVEQNLTKCMIENESTQI